MFSLCVSIFLLMLQLPHASSRIVVEQTEIRVTVEDGHFEIETNDDIDQLTTEEFDDEQHQLRSNFSEALVNRFFWLEYMLAARHDFSIRTME